MLGKVSKWRICNHFLLEAILQIRHQGFTHIFTFFFAIISLRNILKGGGREEEKDTRRNQDTLLSSLQFPRL